MKTLNESLSTLSRMANRQASSPEQWELAGKVLDDGFKQGFLKNLKARYEDVEKGLKKAKEESANLKRIGVGRTEDGNLLLAHVVGPLRDLAEFSGRVANAYERKFK